MLTYISADEVRSIIRLAEQAAARGDSLIDRAVQTDLRGPGANAEKTHATPRGGTEIEDLAPLGASTMAAPLRHLRTVIAEMAPEARRELSAIAMIGRGDYAGREWDAALTAAEAQARDDDALALAEDADLGAGLAKGLYQLKLA